MTPGYTHADALVEPVTPPVPKPVGQAVQKDEAVAPCVVPYVPTGHEKMPLESRTATTPTVPLPGQYEPAGQICTVLASNW